MVVTLLIPVQPAAAATVSGYFRAPWSDVIHEVTNDGKARPLTYAQWKALGSPSPRIAPAQYQKVSWSPTIYGLVTWPNANDSRVDQVVALTPGAYAAAGRPRFATVPHIERTVYYRWESNAQEIFARTPDGTRHKLTFPQWVAAGAPAPATAYGGYYRSPWSDIVHAVSTQGKATRVSYAQWVAAGSPKPALTPVAYVKTPWAPTVAAIVTWPTSPTDRSEDLVVALTWDEYVRAGKPAIQTRTRIKGDSFVKYTVADTIFHVVAGILTPLTPAQWKSVGSPSPTMRTAPTPTYIRGVLMVNKTFSLPPGYGAGLTAETQSAFAGMRGAASSSGLNLYISSGFRSYETQRDLWNRTAAREGAASADRSVARPGHSEHQSGLTFDINTVAASFAHTPEGRWVRDNAHHFGFIVRYPEGKEHITGYIYEPWHLRYVGVDVATHLYRTGLTLEEYLMVPSRYPS